MRICVMNIIQHCIFHINKTVSSKSTLKKSFILYVLLIWCFDGRSRKSPWWYIMGKRESERGMGKGKKQKREKKKKKKQPCVGWYDETFITLWERSQSDLYFNTPCWNQREWNRNSSVTAWRALWKIVLQRNILIETLNGNSNGLIMN